MATFGVFALFPLLANVSRPLLPISQSARQKSVWTNQRDKLVFNNKDADYYRNYTDAAAAIAQTGGKRIGLLIGGDSWEYPLWRYLRKNAAAMPRLEHVKPDAIPAAIEVLFILERPDALSSLAPRAANDSSAFVFRRDRRDHSPWEMLFPPSD